MTKLPYVDCQGLGGAWTLGTIQTGGFELVHRASLKGGFGDQIVEDNRSLLGSNWEQDPEGASDDWEPRAAAYVNGTPPCAGFSLLNVSAAAARKAGKDVPSSARGIDSAINSCMKELVNYTARCTGMDGRRGPEVVSFESVQQAGRLGRPLMQALRRRLEVGTDQKYSLSHVFMSGSSIGAAQMRHRYFVVFHRIPFGVDRPEPRRVVNYTDAIGDLTGYDLQWEPQEYKITSNDAWWLNEQHLRRDTPPVSAHATYGDESRTRQIYLHELLPIWKPGMERDEVFREYRRIHGHSPAGAEHWWLNDEDKLRGFSGPRRVDPSRPGYVMTGGAVGEFFHWAEDRYLTVRECARLMGYPDSWSFASASGINQASNWIGKCCPVQSGRWISKWVLRALNGEPGAPLEQIGDDEFEHDSTLDYRRWDREVSRLSPSIKGSPPKRRAVKTRPLKDQDIIVRPNVSTDQGTFEEDTWRPLIERLRPGDRLLDVGAYIGTVARPAAKAGASVWAYEPCADSRAVLEQNVEGLESVYVIDRGISHDGSRRTLYMGRSPVANSFWKKRGGKEQLVQTDSFMDAVDRIKPTAVKIDAEGVEFELLEDLYKLPKNVRLLAIELHPFKDEERHAHVDRFLHELQEHGWKFVHGPKKAWYGKVIEVIAERSV